MQVILGVIFHFIGGFASGSFYMPYKKVKIWSWESFWIVGGLFSWLIVPPVAAYLTIPGFADIIKNTPVNILTATYVMGLLWGIGMVSENFEKDIYAALEQACHNYEQIF